jgi:Putative zinc-finger
MGQFDEFDSTSMACAVCEAMCPDAVDGTLTDAERRAFDKHLAGCVSCAEELAEAQRGAAWMAMLKGHTPEPPAALLQRILAETTGAAQAVAIAPVPVAAPVFEITPLRSETGNGWSTRISAFRRKLTDIFSLENARMGFQPRFAMTAAMAFFSIALTLNMTGVRLTDLRADSLRPSSLRRAVADMGASATRSFQNLRVVYQVESRVNDLRNNDDEQNIPGTLDRSHGSSNQAPDSNGTTAPQDKPVKKDTPPQGTSELMLPMPRYATLRKGA